MQWAVEKFETIDKVGSYYESLRDIADGGLSVGDSEIEAQQRIYEAVKDTYEKLDKKRGEIAVWLSKLQKTDAGVFY
jgi:hypothetical protein